MLDPSVEWRGGFPGGQGENEQTKKNPAGVPGRGMGALIQSLESGTPWEARPELPALTESSNRACIVQ